MRIAVYVRVSTLRQAVEGDSVEAQRNETTKFIDYKTSCQKWQADSVEYYVDAGKSAKDQNRPELQRLKRDVEAGRINTVVCVKLDRLTRSLIDFHDLWSLFEEHGVTVISLREEFNTATSSGRAMLKLVMIFAEMERELTAERTIAVMEDRVSRGLWNGGWVCGYKSDSAEPGKLVIDPETAPIVKRVFDAMEELGSAGAVLRQLKSEGITVPVRVSRYGRARGGAPLKRQQVLTLLRNPLFIGRVQWGPAFRDDCHEPIVTKAQFERVQRLLDANRQGRTNTRKSRDYGYPLRGLVRCRCGAMMTPKGAFARGRQYHYYSCTTKAHRTREGCGAKDVPAEALEQAVVRRLSEIASSDADRRQIRDEAVRLVEADATRLGTETATAKHRLSEVAGQIGRLVALLRDPDFDALVSVKRQLQGLEAEQAEVRERVNQLEAQSAPLTAVIAAAREFIDNWTGLDAILAQATPDELRTILPHFVEVVEIRPTDDTGHSGEYRLAVLPGLRIRSDYARSESGGSLTDPPLFRGVERKAPPVGFEPTGCDAERLEKQGNPPHSESVSPAVSPTPAVQALLALLAGLSEADRAALAAGLSAMGQRDQPPA